MRFLALLLLLLTVLACGCSSSPHSFLNGDHVLKHFISIYDDLHALHVDIDHVFFDIYEYEESMEIGAN